MKYTFLVGHWELLNEFVIVSIAMEKHTKRRNHREDVCQRYVSLTTTPGMGLRELPGGAKAGSSCPSL